MDASTIPEMGVDPLSSVSMATTDAEEGEEEGRRAKEEKKGVGGRRMGESKGEI